MAGIETGPAAPGSDSPELPPPPPPPPDGSPESRARPPVPEPPPGYFRPASLAGTLVLLALGIGLVAVSLATPWWSYSVGFADGGSNSFAFYPGADYSVACSGSGCGGLPSGSEAYGSHGLAAVGNLYGTVLGVTAAAIVCVILSVALAVVALVRRRRDRRPFVLAGVLAVVGFLLVIGAVAGVVASQPSALGQGAGGIPTAAPSPAASFWGSCQSGGSGSGGACAGSGSGPSESASWGAGLGWYLALAGAVTWLVGLVGLFRRPPREWVLAGVRPPGPSDAR